MTDSTHTHCAHHQQQPHEGIHGAGWGDAASATLHCLTGCAIGEFLGLAIGVSAGWSPAATMALAVILAFAFGYALTLIPFVRRGVPLGAALRTVWLGELVSISVMEIVINAVDYGMGGMSVDSVMTIDFWSSYIVAMGAGFIAAWPVNRWLLARNLKNCH